MSKRTRKWLIFSSVLLLWLVADLVSKHWADTNLATPRHPLPVIIQESEAGMTLEEVLKARFDYSDAQIPEVILRLQRLAPPLSLSPDDLVFAADAPIRGIRGFWAFWREDRNLPPRRIDVNPMEIVTLWAGGKDENLKVSDYQDRLDKLSFRSWLPQIFIKFNDARIDKLFEENRLFPILPAEMEMEATERVAPGETFLIISRHVDVMGDWFKYSYAENPGAAFGFLKGLSGSSRFWIFFSLTLIAFIVIARVTYRLPDHVWWSLSALASITGGAAGNFVDRIRYNYVIDFIDMDLGFMHWPTYNVADIAITAGVIALFLDMLFNKQSPLAHPPKKSSTKA